MEDYQKKIRSIAIARNVDRLGHFTQVQNLPEIIQHGLLSRQQLAQLGNPAFHSADYRLDDNNNAVSVSISRINDRMFASKRKKSGNPYWVVLVLSSEILWSLDCRFWWTNAAKREIKNWRGFRGGHKAFARMFDGSEEEREGLPDYFPTDPEAEVQVLEPIAPHYIRYAIVDQEMLVEPVQNELNKLPKLPGLSRVVSVQEFKSY